MDELDRDLLIMSAQAYSLNEMKTDFPMLSEDQIKRLKAEIRNRK